MMARSSSLTLPVTATLDQLQVQLERQVPLTLRELDEDRDACVPATFARVGSARRQVTPAVGCHLAGKITRGPLVVDGAGNVFRVTIPVRIQVTARGLGSLGRHVQETARGELRVVASAVVGVGPDWTPSLKVSTEHDWEKPIGVDILGTRITFASLADPTIEKTLRALEQDLPRQLKALRLREQAADAWRRAHVVVAVGSAPDAWLRFTPQQVALQQLSIRDRLLGTTINVVGVAETFVGAEPPPVTPTALPPLGRAPSGSPAGDGAGPATGAFNFSLPVSVDYAVLEAAAEQKLKRGARQTFEVPGTGPVALTVTDVTLFQTDRAGLAIGVSVDARGAGGVLDTKGTVWFVARLQVDNADKRLVISSLTVASETNNAPIDLLVALSKTPSLNAALREAMAWSFARDLDAAVANANAAIARRPLPGDLWLQGKIDRVTASDVQAGPGGLVTTVLADGHAGLTLGLTPGPTR